MKTRTRLLSILLSMLLLLGVLPPAVFAAQAEEEPIAAAQLAEEAQEPVDILNFDLPEIELPRAAAPAKAPRRNGEAPAVIDFDWDETTKTLALTGVGAMQDYALGEDESNMLPETPWSAYHDKAQTVVIGEGITHVGAVSFAAFEALETVILPSTLTSIGDYAFAYCISLASADLPSGLTAIGEGAFAANSLTNVVIPAGVTELSECFIYNLAKLSVTLPEGIQTITNCFEETVIESLTIPASVTAFGPRDGDSSSDYSIYNVKTLTNHSAAAVVTPYLKSIADNDLGVAARFALYKCEYAASVHSMRTGEYPQDESYLLPTYNEILGTNYETWDALLAAFENGEITDDDIAVFDAMGEVGAPLSSIKIYCLSESAEHEALRTLGYPHYLIDQDNALCTEPVTAKCGDNMTWAVENGVLTITGYGEMYDNYSGWLFYKDEIDSIRFVNDGGSISKIGDSAFRGLGAIDSIELPAGRVMCGWEWIANCTVGNLILPAGFVYSNPGEIYYLFQNATIEEITVDPANETYFAENGGLYTKGDDSTLAYFFGSGYVVIKDGTVRINHYAVYRNDAVTSITIPASVVSIGQNYPFEGCSNLKKVILAQRTQPLTISAGMFQSCDALEEYIVSENDPFFTAVDGVLYSKDMKTLYAVPFAKTELIIPASVEGVVTNVSTAYSYRNGLEALTVENPSFNFGYLNSGNTTAFTMAKDAAAVTVTGHTGSTAEAFALKNGFRFVSLEGITIESVVFDRSGVPATVTIGDQADFWRWNITGVVTYSDGTTKTIRYANVSNNDFSIQFKYPRETGWRDNSSLTFDYLGDYEFKIVYGEFVEPFTITVQEANYHYEFDVSEAITEVKQYSSTSNYQQSHDVQMGEYWTSVTDSVLGVKLYKVFDDGVTERELQSLGSVRISYDGSDNWWGTDVKGLGLLKGSITRIPNNNGELKIPHMGWNSLNILNNNDIFKGIDGSPYFYFVHSYFLNAQDKNIVSAQTEYGVTIDAAVSYKNIFATQFHPEKSGEAGLQILRNFVDLTRRKADVC